VREWFSENWERWEEEKPDWFNRVFVSHIDDDLLSKEVLEELTERDGGCRRRSSFGGASGRITGGIIRSLTNKKRAYNVKISPQN